MKQSASFSLILAVSWAMAACGNGGSGSTGGGSTSATTGASGSTSATTGTGGSTGATTGTGGAAGPKAPVITEVMPLEGALHVAWTNVTPNCDKIELLRKHDGGTYAVAYTLAGAATSQHDMGAVPPGMYCYKATCTQGAATSPDSNEKCGSP